jgi:hypothetical protein
VTNLLTGLQPKRVTVQHDAGQDVTSRVIVAYKSDRVTLTQAVLPLWTAWGPGRFESVSDDQGGHLAVVWEDAKTRCTVRLSYNDNEPIRFEAEDRANDKDPSRATEVHVVDQAERRTRIKAGKPLTRLPRQLEWDQVKLGVTRDEALKALPNEGKAVLKRDLADAVVFTFGTDAAKSAALVARQLVLRFDKAGKVVEMRARYENGPAGKGFKDLLAGLQKKGGAPSEPPAPWAALWSGLPERKPSPVLSTWQDDLTVMSCQTDATGAEVSLLDWPSDQDRPPKPAPLELLPRGPESCQLGDKRDELQRRWMVSKPEVLDGALVLRPAAGGRYDVFLVYFDGDVVNRIVARQALPAKQAPTQPAQMATALSEAWGRDLSTLSWPRRQDYNDKNNLTGLGWHDDRTQIWLFWQEAGQGPPRVYTEWKNLPAVPK